MGGPGVTLGGDSKGVQAVGRKPGETLWVPISFECLTPGVKFWLNLGKFGETYFFADTETTISSCANSEKRLSL